MIRCPQCNANLLSSPIDSHCPHCKNRLSDRLQPDEFGLHRTLDTADPNCDFELGATTASDSDLFLSPATREPQKSKQTVDASQDTLPKGEQELGRTLDGIDQNTDMDWSIGTPSLPVPAPISARSVSSQTIPDVGLTNLHAVEIGKTIDSSDLNCDFELSASQPSDPHSEASPTSLGMNSSRQTFPDTNITLSSLAEIGRTLDAGDLNADIELARSSSEPPSPKSFTSNRPGSLQQTIPDASPPDVSAERSRGTIPELGDRPHSRLGATIDDGLPVDASADAKPPTASDLTAMTFDSNIDLKPHSTLARDVDSMRTLDESISTRDGDRSKDQGVTLDVGNTANSETGDFSVDEHSPPINATIHIKPGDLTLGEAPISIASARTKNAGATMASHGDSSEDAPDELLLKSISKRSLANEDARAAGIVSPDYKIVKKLGEGGMGVVYSAIQKSLDRHVAVKAIKGGSAVSNDARRKFFYEARITGDLDHPNIVPVHEIGTQEDGTLFYSMKMVDGTPWQDVIKEKSREENLEIFMKVCDAVAFAHSRNVAHRDLKPENVMLGAFGEVLVMDWGLAIQLPPARPFGMSGTPAYMSPEMAKHDVPKIGKSSDIYILGGILYELITGSAPHSGRNVRECLMNAMHNEIVPTEMVDPLIDIARHAMATQVEDRFATVVELQEAIREVMQHAESISLTRRAEDWLHQATRESDYQGFSRACFSMQEAIDLWPENQSAIDGLLKAKFAYGQSALERGDYDLCLQVMDPSNPQHAAKMQTARERKQANTLRESRLRLTKRILVGVVLTAAGVLSFSTAYALRQAELARRSAAEEKAAKNIAENALVDKGIALEEKEKARSEEAQARIKEATAKEDAVRQAELARKAKNEAEVNAREAVNQSRIAILGSYQSKVTLANAQSVQLETPQSTQSIRELSNLAAAWPNSSDAAQAALDPRIEDVEKMLSNWAIRRIQYFNNEDLPKLDSDCPLLSMDYDPVSGWLVALDAKQRLKWLRPDGQKFEWDSARNTSLPGLALPVPASHIAIAPGGKKLVVLSRTADDQSSAYLLLPEKNLSIPVQGVDRKPLQRTTFTENGRWLVGGINTGLWRWQVLEDGLAKPSVMNFRGTIDSLHGLHGDKANFVFGISRLPQNAVSCFVADLENEAVYPIQIPNVDSAKLTTAAMAPDGQSIVIGFDDGSIVPMDVVWRPSANQESSVQWILEVDRDFATTVEKFRSRRWHRKPIEEIRFFRDGSIMSRASEPVIPIWSIEKGNQLSQPRFLSGLSQSAQFFEFLQDGESILAADTQGTIMRWNRREQSQRNGELVLRSPQIKDAPAVGIVHTQFDKSLSPIAIDENGVLLTRGNTEIAPDLKPIQLHYVGHSPYATVISAARGLNTPWIATLARLSKNSYAYVGSKDATTELCVWSLNSGKMLTRILLPTGPNARISFLHSDAILCVTDGISYWNIRTDQWLVGTPDNRFGASLSIAHPTQPKWFTLIANSGSVRIVDATDPSSWDNDNYRNFDLAINNRSNPIHAAWSPDGLCLFVLFDNGRVARLKWDGRQLRDLDWSSPLLTGIDAESDVAWNFVDFEVLPQTNTPEVAPPARNGASQDRLRIAKRTSEANRRTRLLILSWDRDAREPSNSSDDEVAGDRYFVPGQDLAWNRSGFAGSASSHAVVQTLPGPGNSVDAVDSSGSIYRDFDQIHGKKSLPLGSRQPCIDAVSDPSGQQWLSLHRDQAIWFAQSNESGRFDWTPFPHNLVSIRQMTFSHTGDNAWLIGRDANGDDIAVWYALNRSNSEWVRTGEETNIRHVIEDVRANDWILLTTDRQLHRGAWRDGTFQRQSLAGNGPLLMPEFEVKRLAWFSQLAVSDRVTDRTLILLSNSQNTSRMDWLAIDAEHSQWQAVLKLASPNEITTLSASPNGNIFVTGDRAGTLSVWFASPQIDEQARPLFNLPNHAGNRINATQFSAHADRLISADSGGRVFGWYTTLGPPPVTGKIVSLRTPDSVSHRD